MEKKRLDLEKLWFGVYIWDCNTDKPKCINLFGSIRVLYSVACWVLMNDKQRRRINSQLGFCFGDTRARVEYEMLVSDLSDNPNRNIEKMDVWTLYVAPNEGLLLDMVNHVTKASARRVKKKYARR